MYFPPAPRPVPQHYLLLLSQQWPLRGLERWAEEGRSGGESEKREKGEHLVCRALISIALGEQALPTFPHTHTHVHIFSHSHTQWWLATRQHLPGVEKRGCVVQTTAGVAVWGNGTECVRRCATVGQSIIHTPRSAFQWFLPEKREPKRQATGKGFLSWESYVPAHSHIEDGGMIHIQDEWEQRCCSCFNDLPCHSSYLQPHVDVACRAGGDLTGPGWPVWPVQTISCWHDHMLNTTSNKSGK